MTRRVLLLSATLMAAGFSTPAFSIEAAAQGSAPAPQGAGKSAVEVATFASGCFWCTESDFDKVPGVISTTSGYTGGRVANPTYEQVSSGGTGHTEAVEVRYDPSKVSYAQLLDTYWHNVDPFTSRGQFCDFGEQYRPAIFVHNAAQRGAAEASKQEMKARFSRPIVVAIENAGRVLSGRGLPPGLSLQELGPLQLLPMGLRPRRSPRGDLEIREKAVQVASKSRQSVRIVPIAHIKRAHPHGDPAHNSVFSREFPPLSRAPSRSDTDL